MRKILTLFCVSALAGAFCTSCKKDDLDPVFPKNPGTAPVFYDGGEKVTCKLRKDKLMIKAKSIADAKELGTQEIFTYVQPIYGDDSAYVGVVWVRASIDPEITTLDDVLNLSGVADAAYGLELDGYDDWVIYMNDKLYIGPKSGLSPEEVLRRAGLAKSIVSIELIHAEFNGYDVILNVRLSDILWVCQYLYESGLCRWAEPGLFDAIRPGK